MLENLGTLIFLEIFVNDCKKLRKKFYKERKPLMGLMKIQLILQGCSKYKESMKMIYYKIMFLYKSRRLLCLIKANTVNYYNLHIFSVGAPYNLLKMRTNNEINLKLSNFVFFSPRFELKLTNDYIIGDS